MSRMKNEDLLMLYTSGKNYVEFLETNSGYYRDNILAFKNNVAFSIEFIDEIKAVEAEKYFLAIGEPWCENCVINITLLQVISEINEKINYRIIPQVDVGDALKHFCDNDEIMLPIIFELSTSGDIIGTFCEKPSVLRTLRDSSPAVRTAMKRKYRQGGFAVETVREILKI